MKNVHITVGVLKFTARFEESLAPVTCAAFRSLLPFHHKIIHARWSGEACWIPLGERHLDIKQENATSYPSRGDILYYPGGASEAEILIPYGSTLFASKVGQLAGNHFMTVVEGLEHLPDLGRLCLWHGAQEISFEKGADAPFV